MRLPDPFTPNLKIDVLVDGAQSPRILSDITQPLANIKPHLDRYISFQQPVDLPAKLPSALMTETKTLNQTLTTSVVMYLATQAIRGAQEGRWTLESTPVMAIYKQLCQDLDAEGRYFLLNTMANQLRYPNSHTSFFAHVLLNLFADAGSEYIQEQLTRVLLERLIVHRPHPVRTFFTILCLLTEFNVVLYALVICQLLSHFFIHSYIGLTFNQPTMTT